MKKLLKRSKLKTNLRDKAWDIQSLAIRKEENWTCFTCGVRIVGKDMHAGHFRHGKHMDFVRKNIHAQCARCNKWLHGNLGVYAINLDKKYGAGTADELLELSKHYRGYRKADYLAIIKQYSV